MENKLEYNFDKSDIRTDKPVGYGFLNAKENGFITEKQVLNIYHYLKSEGWRVK